MTKHVAVNAILAIGVTFVILTGGIDLSVGSIAGLSSMVVGGLLFSGLTLPGGGVLYLSVVAVVVVGILVGCFVGSVNGILITKFRVPPFIATLGMLYVARGAAQLLSNGGTFPGPCRDPAHGNQGFHVIGVDKWLGIPVAVWIMVAVAAVAVLVTTKTPSDAASMPSAGTTAPRSWQESGSPASRSPSTSSAAPAPRSPACC